MIMKQVQVATHAMLGSIKVDTSDASISSPATMSVVVHCTEILA